MNRFVYIWIVFLLIAGCKTKQPLANGVVDKNLKLKELLDSHDKSFPDFKTLRGKINVDFKQGDKEQGVSLSYRLKKDEFIWLSAPLGMFKAVITPKRVSFYNRLENEYFDGDFELLNQLLGIPMDYEKMQNLLLGHLLFDNQVKYKLTYGKGYMLAPKKNELPFDFLSTLSADNFKVQTNKVWQGDPGKHKEALMSYTYDEVDGGLFPETIKILIDNEGEVTSALLVFKGMERDKNVSAPYKIPNGFNQIILK